MRRFYCSIFVSVLVVTASCSQESWRVRRAFVRETRILDHGECSAADFTSGSSAPCFIVSTRVVQPDKKSLVIEQATADLHEMLRKFVCVERVTSRPEGRSKVHEETVALRDDESSLDKTYHSSVEERIYDYKCDISPTKDEVVGCKKYGSIVVCGMIVSSPATLAHMTSIPEHMGPDLSVAVDGVVRAPESGLLERKRLSKLETKGLGETDRKVIHYDGSVTAVLRDGLSKVLSEVHRVLETEPEGTSKWLLSVDSPGAEMDSAGSVAAGSSGPLRIAAIRYRAGTGHIEKVLVMWVPLAASGVLDGATLEDVRRVFTGLPTSSEGGTGK